VGDVRAGSLRRLAELLTLTAFAFAQPLLDITGRSPDFFLYRRVTPSRMRILVAAIVLGPPLALWTAEVLVGLVNRTAEKVLHLVFCATLFTILAIEVGKHLHGFTGVPLALLAAVVGVALAVLVARSPGFRSSVMYATPAPLVFALLFVLTSPAGALVRAGGGSHSSAAAAAAPRPPLVFRFLDEFPQRALLDNKGQVDARLYPNFARLAAASNWYPNATGVSGFTPYAAPAMLSGRYPQKSLAPSYIEYPQSLFTLLAGTYDITAYETIAELCPPSICGGAAAGRKVGLRALAQDTAKLTGEIVSPYRSKTNPTEQYVEQAVDATKLEGSTQATPDTKFRFRNILKRQPARFPPFLDGLRPTGRPTLNFLHLLLPHGPWKYAPSGNEYIKRIPATFPPQPANDTVQGRTASEPELEVIRKQRLMLQTAYTDGLLGEMLDRMKQTGLYDDALIVVTADHGVGLTPATYARQMDAKNPADLTYVPLFVKLPHQKKGKVDLRNEQQVDLLPTIADVLRLHIPWDVDGQSALGPARKNDDKLWYDVPGTPKHIPAKDFADRVRTGYAMHIARPELGKAGLYAVGPLKFWVGKKISEVAVGPPSPVHAKLLNGLGPFLANVDLATGLVPSMFWGDLDQPLGPASTWLLASVNGTIAGNIAAVRGYDGKFRFVGIADDQYFTAGATDVSLWSVDGTTLHRIAVSS
jgi:hypothetical protein